MQVYEKPLDEIMPYENNPRNNENAIDKVAESIKQFGFKAPIIIDKQGVIVAGHTRYKASKLLGLKTVPCIIADDLTPEQIKAYRLADNKTAEFSNWDFSLLENELSNIDNTIDMTKFGFENNGEIPDIDNLFEDTELKEPKDKEPETIICPNCGEVIEI